MDSLETMVRGIRSDLDSAQHPLADHHSFAAECAMQWMVSVAGLLQQKRIWKFWPRQTSFKQETLRYNATEQSTKCPLSSESMVPYHQKLLASPSPRYFCFHLSEVPQRSNFKL